MSKNRLTMIRGALMMIHRKNLEMGRKRETSAIRRSKNNIAEGFELKLKRQWVAKEVTGIPESKQG
jgi:hypothetical protein